MPFINKIQSEFGTIGIWKLTEPVDELIEKFQFSEKERAEIDKIKFDKRKCEYITSRLLLEVLLNKKVEISYHESGKPILSDEKLNVSISHSAELVVVFTSHLKIGIDVEKTDRKIEKIANRFLHSTELDHIRNLDNVQLASILYWSAKEAIFKCTDHSGILFDKEIRIPQFDIKEEGSFCGTLTSNKQLTNYLLNYFFCENNVIVFCVEGE